ncbi:MAG: DinB family protein [Bacteroidota bacterium]|nr:DinB family protein [Bacteroidota bacterium]MDP4232878.1 DinB family protein [Bacteroidota bacterium]MDP4241922.1 DinB family protein [Bacteroidota bacterium]MDP4286825.1 DinB family protein [Bacteroidota bacterium]
MNRTTTDQIKSTAVFSDIAREALSEQTPSAFLDELRHQYANLIIQLDRIRPSLIRTDLHRRPEGEDWSITEIFGHMIDTDNEIWWPRIEAILVEHYPYFTDIDPMALVRKHNWQALPLDDVLSQLMRIRWNHAMRLNTLPAEVFDRPGYHPAYGELTLLRVVQLMVAHDTHYLMKVRALLELADDGSNEWPDNE